ncbi:MAG: 50S ribosomal protein L11 methyltransferase [Vicinamibacterales bacterium]
MPYLVNIRHAPPGAFERVIDLGALDAELLDSGALRAIMPDSVTPEQVAAATGVARVDVSPAVDRDDGSVWILNVRPVPVGGHEISLTDAPAFGTGLHPTTAMCLQMLEELVAQLAPASMLDVGTGSGVLAIAALKLGVPRALGIDLDDGALRVAAENARANGVGDRLALAHDGPDAIDGTFPLAVANVLAAPLIEMAPVLVRRIAHHGDLVLSGVAASAEREVAQAYVRLGMRHLRTTARAGWVALMLQAAW